jgi:hypothetical protein
MSERRQAMSYSISTLLTRNLQDVFGENDPARRRAAIDEIFTEDCVFYDPSKVGLEPTINQLTAGILLEVTPNRIAALVS